MSGIVDGNFPWRLMGIKHGHHIVSYSYWQPQGAGVFFISGTAQRAAACAMPPALFEASSITSIGNLLISYHFKVADREKEICQMLLYGKYVELCRKPTLSALFTQ